MPVILYCGFDVNPLVKSLLRNYRAEGLAVISGTMHDFMLSGLRIFYEADSIILASSGFGERLSDDARFACWKLMEQLGTSVFPPVPEEMVAFSIFRMGLTGRGVDTVSSFTSLSEALKLGFTVLPLTEDIPSVHVKHNGRETRLLEFLLSKEARRIEGVKVNWDFKPLKQPLSYIKGSESVLIAPSDPVSILPIERNAEICGALRTCEGEVTLVLPPVTPKAGSVLSILGIDSSPLGLANLFEGLIDRVILDQSLSSARKDIASSLGVEALLADLSPSALQSGIPKIILESFPLQKKSTIAVKDVIKGITKVMKLEKEKG
ncbi:MAG: YvcK family protein [Candidatus Freyarchaeota archaeon]|nr:YvcK family protein [Candidatus Jordarchaeia archaeon]